MSKIGFVVVGILVGVLVMLPLALHAPSLEPKSRMPHIVGSSNSAHVVRTVDGDTLVVTISGTEERVRVLGINAPESVDPNEPVGCYGLEASKRMHELADKKNVILVAGNEDRDAYGRLLRFVEVDGKDIGAEMISEGYAENFCASFPHPRCEEYDRLQNAASTGKKGMWSVCQ